MTAMKVLQALCVFCTLLSRVQAYTLTPQTLSDNVSNTADANSNITWATLPQGEDYKSDVEYDDGGMGPLFDFARSFVNTVFPNGFPSELLKDFANGYFDITADYMRVVEDFAGYGACIVIGLLFMIIFTIVGCCFCCCRCCGNCGGKMTHKKSPSSSCRRKVYGVVLLVLVIFTAVGCICVFVSNDRMTSSLNRYGTTVSTNIDDMASFVDNTVSQVNHLLKNDLNFAFDVVKRDLDNIDVLVGVPVRDNLDSVIGATPLFDQIAALQTDVSTAINQFDEVDQDVTNFKGNFTAFKTELDAWVTDYEIDRGNCGTGSGDACENFPDGTALRTDIDPNQIDISASKTEIDKVRNQDMGALVDTARAEFRTIPDRVKNESESALGDISTKIDSYKNDITPLTDTINDIQSQIDNTVNLDNIKADVELYTETAEPYDKYRWYAGVGLTCIIMLVVVLQLLGLIFGVCGSDSDTPSTERGCLSNAGGNMLMASVGFIFIFSWLLMLLTMICFMIGAPMERYFCQSLSDPELKAINQILEDLVKLKPKNGTGSWLGEMILNDPSISLSIEGVLADCKEGKTAYSAFKLQYLSGFNLTKVTNYKDSIDIENQLNSINVDWTQVEVAPQSLKDNMNDFKNSITNMNFAKYQTELNKDATGSDLNAFLTDFQTRIDGLPNSTEKTDLQTRHNELEAIRDGSYTNTIAAKNKLNASLAQLSATFNGLPAKIDNLLNSLTAVETKLQNNGSDVLREVLVGYMNRIFNIVDSLIDRAVNGLKDDIARCTPIYNLYQSLIVIGLCKYMLDAFNGFWFSLGWSIFFFVPSTVFAVKLAKHYRRMKFQDEYESTLPSKHHDVVRNGRNKVGHSDKF